MRRRLRLLGLLLAAACTVACQSDPPQEPCDASVPGARVEGVVHTGGLFVRAEIRAQQRDMQTYYFAPVDSGGAYALDLPPGSYRLSIFMEQSRYFLSPNGAIGFSEWPEDLRVEAGDRPRKIDVWLGNLRVIVNAPFELEGELTRLSAVLVLDASGAPVHHDRSMDARVRNGVVAFTLIGLVPGTYEMAMVLGEGIVGGEIFWLPGTRDEAAADRVTVVPDRLTIHGAALPEEPTWVTGRIEGSWQQMGFPPPTLEIHSLQDAVVSGEQRADDEGAFRFRLLVPEPIRIRVRQDDRTRWIGGWTFEEATIFEPAADRPLDIVDRDGGLFLEIDGPPRPFGAGTIRLIDPGTLESVADWSFHESLGEVYPFANLLPGRYLLRIEPHTFLESSWLGQWFDGAGSIEQAQAIEVPEGGVLPLAIQLVEGGSIEGRVEFENIGEIWNATMALTPEDRLERLGAPRIDYDIPGVYRYQARGLAEGRYKMGIQIRREGEPEPVFPDGILWYPGTASWDSAGVLVIENHGPITGIDFSVSP